MTADDYIRRVLAAMPKSMPRRAQIGLELRAHVVERSAAGDSLDDVLRQLGDPEALADSYLAAIPLENPPLAKRVAAKLVDVALALATGVVLTAFLYRDTALATPDLLLTIALCGCVVLCVYTIVAETFWAQTLGKRTFRLHVVRESGRRMHAGHALVRQLPLALSIFLIDALFLFFTDRQQRAFELLSKTRVVPTFPEE